MLALKVDIENNYLQNDKLNHKYPSDRHGAFILSVRHIDAQLQKVLLLTDDRNPKIQEETKVRKAFTNLLCLICGYVSLLHLL